MPEAGGQRTLRLKRLEPLPHLILFPTLGRNDDEKRLALSRLTTGQTMDHMFTSITSLLLSKSLR